MKRLLYISLVGICTCGWGQPVQGSHSSGSGNERYRIFTDRSRYVAGEEIHFRAFNLSPDSLQELSWSRVYYAELISPDGFSHTRAKYAMDPGGSGGILKIPSEIPSGTYFLKGYTKWMRNFGPENYSYVSVEVINPYRRELLPVDTTSQHRVQLQQPGCEPGNSGSLKAGTDGSYSRRAPVMLHLSLPGDRPAVHCCITVIRNGMLEKQWESVPAAPELRRERIEQMPETRGISLAGKVEVGNTGIPAPYAVVYLSLMGDRGDFFANYTDSAGRFYFALPDRHGETELYISANHANPVEPKLFIEQDFCTEPVTLPSFPLDINGMGIGLIREMSVNAQIGERYDPAHDPGDDPATSQRIFFYGAPTTTVRFDDFIKLPTMEEYFTEVTPKVSLRRVDGMKKFRVLGDHPDLVFFEPLVMIDGVAIFNVESVLALSPRYVDRLEIFDSPYVRGNVTFGGIINIITRNGDLGFIDLPASGVLLNYSMYQEVLPGEQIGQPLDPRIPDVRNTLYWNPDVELLPGDQRTIGFRTADVNGDYQVVLRGIDASGACFQEFFQFSVE